MLSICRLSEVDKVQYGRRALIGLVRVIKCSRTGDH